MATASTHNNCAAKHSFGGSTVYGQFGPHVSPEDLSAVAMRLQFTRSKAVRGGSEEYSEIHVLIRYRKFSAN